MHFLLPSVLLRGLLLPRCWLRCLLLVFVGMGSAQAAHAAPDGFIVVAHPSVSPLDVTTLRRLYMGRAIEVAGTPVNPVNLAVGEPLRSRFFAEVLGEDNDKYVAYWTVRRHIGKGIPPRELKTAAEVIDFVRNTPGGLGYIAASDLRPGLNVVFKP